MGHVAVGKFGACISNSQRLRQVEERQFRGSRPQLCALRRMPIPEQDAFLYNGNNPNGGTLSSTLAVQSLLKVVMGHSRIILTSCVLKRVQCRKFYRNGTIEY